MRKAAVCMGVLMAALAGAASGQEFPFGKEFDYPFEWGSLVVNRDSLVLDGSRTDGSLRLQDGLMTMQAGGTAYTVLHCAVGRSEFVTLLKEPASKKYAWSAWEMPYSVTDDARLSAMPVLRGFRVIRADSFVSEQDRAGERTDFIPAAAFDFSGNPWAVGGSSAGKRIYLDTERWRHPSSAFAPIDAMVVVNGFVHPGKERLFTQNARARRIRVSYGGISFEHELEDTGNYQVVPLPQGIDPKSRTVVEVEVLDCYPGTKYDDIVISGIFYVDAELGE